MALADPQKLKTIGEEATLPRVSTSGNSSIYESSDGTKTLTLSHQSVKGSRKRSVIRVDEKKFTADPFKPAENVQVSSSVYLVIDHPLTGFTLKELGEIAVGLETLTSASEYKVLNQLLGGES
jgi:hypothetical protein